MDMIVKFEHLWVKADGKTFSPPAKSFISIWSNAWERAPGWFQGGLVVSGRGSDKS